MPGSRRRVAVRQRGVLSIAKLSSEQAPYYAGTACGRVDAAQSIGGAEDYYGEAGRAPSAWVGAGARRLGLSGSVSDAGLRRAFAGEHPRHGDLLRHRRGPQRNAAIDLTFSAPKSVSLLFGVGATDVEATVRAAHDEAVTAALGYLERRAARVRRGRNGTRVLPAEGFVAATFRHRASRAGDPQLHTHAVVANMARGPDGRWTALDARPIYAHAMAAGCLYQAVLRERLTAELGVTWAPVRDGLAELDGVPAEVLRAFSRRRVEIEAELARRGTSGPAATEAAALATRRRKDVDVDGEALRRDWQQRAADLGFKPTTVVGCGRSPALTRRQEATIYDDLAGPDGLTARRSSFTAPDVVAAIASVLPAGLDIDVEGIEALAARFLDSERLVPLASSGERRWSTTELLGTERRLVALAHGRRCAGRGLADAEALSHACLGRPSLSDEQRTAVRRLTSDGDGIVVVIGVAGAGKTFALRTCADAWRASGTPVCGAAVARRAARELETGAGIPSTSIRALLIRLDDRPLQTGTVLVIDEAGMAGTRALAALAEAVDTADGKLVLVGDDRQLDSIDAGGAFRALARRGPSIQLSQNRRQVHEWEHTAAAALRDGDPRAALVAYARHDRITVTHRGEEARQRLISDWIAQGATQDVVMLAHRRRDVADLNLRARRHLRIVGRLGIEEARCAAGRITTGDVLIVRQNLPAHDLANGDRGTVRSVDHRGRVILDVRGTTVELGADALLGRTHRGEPVLQYGYALTGHSAQGLTARRALVLADPGVGRDWLYTAMTRGRDANQLYLVARRDRDRDEFGPSARAQPDAIEALAAQLERHQGQELALDQVPHRVDRSRPARGRSGLEH